MEVAHDMDTELTASPIGDQPLLEETEDIDCLDEYSDKDDDLGDCEVEDIVGDGDEI